MRWTYHILARRIPGANALILAGGFRTPYLLTYQVNRRLNDAEITGLEEVLRRNLRSSPVILVGGPRRGQKFPAIAQDADKTLLVAHGIVTLLPPGGSALTQQVVRPTTLALQKSGLLSNITFIGINPVHEK